MYFRVRLSQLEEIITNIIVFGMKIRKIYWCNR